MQGCGNTMPNVSYFPEEEISVTFNLSWDKNYMALAKKNIQIIFFIFSKKTYIMGTH